MIKNRLSAILGERRLKMSDVARATQLARTTVFNFYHDRSKRIDYPVLDKLCEYLECQPGDLLIHIPDGSETKQVTVDVITTPHPQPKQLNIIVSDDTQNSPKTGRK